VIKIILKNKKNILVRETSGRGIVRRSGNCPQELSVGEMSGRGNVQLGNHPDTILLAFSQVTKSLRSRFILLPMEVNSVPVIKRLLLSANSKHGLHRVINAR